MDRVCLAVDSTDSLRKRISRDLLTFKDGAMLAAGVALQDALEEDVHERQGVGNMPASTQTRCQTPWIVSKSIHTNGYYNKTT